MEKFRILFVCKHNVFRSQVAEAYFNQINKNPNMKATSGGLFPGHPLVPRQIEIAKALGVEMKGKSKGIPLNELKKQNLIVIVADDVPKDIIAKRVYSGEIRYWEVPDAHEGSNYEGAKEIISLIKSKVDELYIELTKKLTNSFFR